MAKVDEWRKKAADWKKIYSEPKNLGLRMGGTGLTEAILKVGDAEMDFAKGKETGKELVTAFNDLNKELGALIDLCKKISDKHKKLFTSACKFVDDVKVEATTRRSEAAREVDVIRHKISEICAEAEKQLKAAKDISGLAAYWLIFVMEFEMAGKAFPTLKGVIAKNKEAPEPTGLLATARPKYLKLVENSKNALASR